MEEPGHQATMNLSRSGITSLRAKEFMDLPDEALSRILELLLPDFAERGSFGELRLVQKSSADVGEQREDNEHETTANPVWEAQFCRPEDAEWLRRSSLVLPPSSENHGRHDNNFANLAATCQRVASQAHSLYARRTFPMSVSDLGVTFEGLRSGFVTHNVLYNLQTVLYGSLPQLETNRACNAFHRICTRLRRLNVSINVDLARWSNENIKMFSEPLGRILSSNRDGNTPLCKLDLHLILGFPKTVQNELLIGCVPGSCSGISPNAVLKAFQKHSTIAELAAMSVTKLLFSFVEHLYSHPRAQSAGRVGSELDHSCKIWQDNVMIHGNGTYNMPWGQTVVMPSMYPGNPGIPVVFGGFKKFCNDVQKELFGKYETAENEIVSTSPWVCKLGLPVPKFAAE